MPNVNQRSVGALELDGEDFPCRPAPVVRASLRDGGVKPAWDVPVSPGAGSRDLVSVNRRALRSSQRLIRNLKESLEGAVFAEPEEMAQLLEGKADDETPFERVVLSGGDGTLNRFLEPILDADVPVQLVPRGTANDLACEMKITASIPGHRGPDEPLRMAHIDVPRASGQPFTTVGYLGFGSEVVTVVNWLRTLSWTLPIQRVLGKFIYVLGVLWVGMTRALPIYSLKVTSGDRSFDIESPLLVVANQPRVGGTMNLARGTRNDDGTFRVLIFSATGGLGLLRSIVDLCRGVPPAHAGVESFEASRVEVASRDGRPFLFCADGEELIRSDRLDLDLHPRKLKLILE